MGFGEALGNQHPRRNCSQRAHHISEPVPEHDGLGLLHDLSDKKDISRHGGRECVKTQIFDAEQDQEWSVAKGRASLLGERDPCSRAFGRGRVPGGHKTHNGGDEDDRSGGQRHHRKRLGFRHAQGIAGVDHQSRCEGNTDKCAHRNPGHPKGHQLGTLVGILHHLCRHRHVGHVEDGIGGSRQQQHDQYPDLRR